MSADLQRAVEDPDDVELLVDLVVTAAPDEGRPEVPLIGRFVLANRRQAGLLQVDVETLHLIGRLVWRKKRGRNPRNRCHFF